jgi:hypothetical protein
MTAAASSSMPIHAMPGGVDGQHVTLVAIGSQVVLSTNSAGLTDGFITSSSGGTSYVIQGSAAVTFVRVTMGSTAKWFEIVDLS